LLSCGWKQRGKIDTEVSTAERAKVKSMNMKEDILNTGTFYWFKSRHLGEVAVPLHYLTDDQKNTLRLGLESNKYELCNPYQYFSSHYMWRANNRGYYLVTDVEISPEIKRKIIPPNSKPAGKQHPYRVILSDMERLLSQLKCGEVDEFYVQSFLSDTPWNPWNELEWKSKRDPIIKNACENCGSQENLVLQHTIQPRKISSILYDLVGDRYEEIKFYVEQNKHTIELFFPDNIKKVPVCPKCGSSQINLRVRGVNKDTYVCNKSNNYLVCKHQFIEPDYGYDEKDIKVAEKKRESLLRDKFCEEKGLLWTAAEKSLEEIITYLSLTHTKTLCNKCAYNEDRPFEKYYG
jgi:hypothetical protein